MKNRVRNDCRDGKYSNDTRNPAADSAPRRTISLILNRLFGPRAHVIPFLARLVVGGVFLAAGILKLGHPADLAAAITAYKTGLPPPLVAVLSLALPPFEILLGIYLIAGLLLPISSLVAAVVLMIFTGIVASAVARGLSAPCGCFGPADTAPATWWTVARDAVLLAGAAYVAWWAQARARQIAKREPA
jgi:uncharacterized membrane protein YphA (DoxX/SURF4 family)